ncbi:MAG: methyl-accepting chemotaxis protein [Magnetococcales bacterium]|nr:methyl-accepting chemotaxis protein [Magnetococcales bacterium]
MKESGTFMIDMRGSLGLKILAMAGLTGTLALLCMGLFAIHKMEQAILQENIQGVNQLTTGVLNGLESIMLGGDAAVARNLSNRLKEMKDLESFRILRLDEQEAFAEDKPDQAVAESSEWAGHTRYDPAKVSSEFNAAVTTRTTITIDHRSTEGDLLKTYLIPILNKEPCHACHGGGHEVRGVLKVTVSLKNMIDNIKETRLELIFVLLVSNVMFLVFLGGVIRKLVIVPINEVKGKMREFAEGERPDLTRPLDFSSKDEMGELAHWFNKFLEVIHGIVGNVKKNAQSLESLATKLETASEYMGDGIDEVNNQTRASTLKARSMKEEMEVVSTSTMAAVAMLESTVETVAGINRGMVTISSAVEESNVNLRNVADHSITISRHMEGIRDAVVRNSANFNTIEDSVKELGSSFNAVQDDCELAQKESTRAIDLANEASGVMEELMAAAQTINNVVSEIREIAEQTNMLSLNAAIEAAGAGEAGKGFAVVSNEVKQLAQRTASATETVTDDVQAIQERTRKAFDVALEVAKMVGTVGSINKKITYSVDEQNDQLQEIHKAISQAVLEVEKVTALIDDSSDGIAETARSTSEISSGMDEVTRNVSVITANISEMSDAVNESARKGTRSAETVIEVARSSQEIVDAMETTTQSTQNIQALSQSVRDQANRLIEVGRELNMQLDRFIV